ncbi:hypothetical protein AG1IA_01458 [Rhizoctonia solani AG-1 IA]|nr:hypothetical protein AG1IA_04802 [Rhizoctonia solani AG-1 IA]ELU44496.1 hypothetical protein AG1IA_01458 [Rhizoctonia solani AG-1 IA]
MLSLRMLVFRFLADKRPLSPLGTITDSLWVQRKKLHFPVFKQSSCEYMSQSCHHNCFVSSTSMHWVLINFRKSPIMSEESPKRQRLTFQQQILPPEDPERELRDMFAQARL